MSKSKRKRQEQQKHLRDREKEEFGEWAAEVHVNPLTKEAFQRLK